LSDQRGKLVADLIEDSDHTILNQNVHTRSSANQAQQPTSPDITTISSNLSDKTNWKLSTTPLRSDHLPIIITIKTKNNFRLLPNIKTFTNFNKAKWEDFTQEIEEALSHTQKPTNVHLANKILTNQILLADKHHIPKGRFKRVNQPLPKHINDVIKQRNILRKSNPLDPNIQSLNENITKLISDHKTEQWKTKLEQIGTHNKNSHTLWRTINILKNKSPQASPNRNIKFNNNKNAVTQQDKSNEFNKQFVNVVKHSTKKINRRIDKTTKALITTPIKITNMQTYEAIKNTKNKNSVGPDNLNIRHLKHLGPTAIQYLTDILNLALNTNTIPQIWKLAKIIPIPKPNKDPNLGTSYRPISLLSPIAKTMEKILLPYITSNIPQVKHQHGFKSLHSTTTALQQITNQIVKGFNQKQPPERTIVVSLDLSKAFDTVNIHNLIHKLQQTNIPNLIKKFVANYIKGRKGYTLYQGSKSKQQQFKTGVPQGGVLSPSLFNLYTSDLPTPPKNVEITSYADDMNPTASHVDYKIAQNNLQPYLEDIFNWTQKNDLILNPDKSTATLFTPDPAEYKTILNLTINNTIIPTIKYPKILGLTFDTKLNFGKHAKITKEKADNANKIVKTLTSTSWGKQKETLIATYKAIVRPILEYASPVWSPIISDTNRNKLQTTQNTALRIATGCTSDTNIQHLHAETKVLPLLNHLNLHASNFYLNTLRSNHPLHQLNFNKSDPRNMKDTIFANIEYHAGISNIMNTTTITDEIIKQNLKINHTKTVGDYLNSLDINELIGIQPPDINPSEQSLPRNIRRTLSQNRTNKSPFLYSYRNKINPQIYPSPNCPLCKNDTHTTKHLFSCSYIKTNLKPLDLWDEPVAVAELLQQWTDAMAAAGGGSGTPV
jgi:hypothetical protein